MSEIKVHTVGVAKEDKCDSNGDVEVTESPNNNHPTAPDGGWGWVVLFASFIIHVICKYKAVRNLLISIVQILVSAIILFLNNIKF